MIFTVQRVQVRLPNGMHHARVTAADAERMVMRDEARQLNGTQIELNVRMRSHHEPMEDKGPAPRIPGAPKSRRYDSSHGDAGRAFSPMVRRTCHTPRETVVAKVPGLPDLGEIVRRAL